MKTLFHQLRSILPVALFGLVAPASDALDSKFANKTNDQVWQAVANPAMGAQFSLAAVDEICGDIMPDSKREALEAKLVEADTPAPGFAYFGKMYLEGKCVSEDRVLGGKLMRLGLMSLVPALYQEAKLSDTPVKPISILPFTLGPDRETQIQAFLPTTEAMWNDEIHRWLAASPADIAAAARKFLSGDYTFFQKDYTAPAPEAAVIWMLAAADTAETIDTVKETISWLHDPALAPSWAKVTYTQGEFTESAATDQTQGLLYRLELRGFKPAFSLFHCLTFDNEKLPRRLNAKAEYIHLQQMKRQGIDVDDALLQQVHAWMIEHGDEEPYVPAKPDFYSLTLFPPILGRCGL